jgi:hypothetical protein
VKGECVSECGPRGHVLRVEGEGYVAIGE